MNEGGILINLLLKGQKGSLYNSYLESTHAESLVQENAKKERIVRENAFVFSLRHGAGTSYIAAAIANYISGVKKGGVTYFTSDTDNGKDYLLPKVNCVSLAGKDADSIYTCADHIVCDGGSFEDMSAVCRDAMFRASTRVLVCRADTAYLKKLAEFTAGRTDDNSFVYLFNTLPDEWVKRVESSMDSYSSVYCLPVFYAKKLPQGVNDIMLGIFGRG